MIKTSGKRKRAIARAFLKKGSGTVRINKVLLDLIQPKMARMKLREPIILAGDAMQKVDIDVSVSGGGVIGQADAARVAIGKALVEQFPDLKETFLDYDRTLLISDVRRKETRKPNCRGKARSKRQKSYR